MSYLGRHYADSDDDSDKWDDYTYIYPDAEKPDQFKDAD